MANFLDKTRNFYVYDMHKKVVSKGEAYDTDAINLSIENILSTTRGERLFNPYFGSILPEILFESIDEKVGEKLIDSIIDDIERWEDRITIIKNDIKFILDRDNNSLEIYIPYFIKPLNVKSSFDRRIIF